MKIIQVDERFQQRGKQGEDGGGKCRFTCCRRRIEAKELREKEKEKEKGKEKIW